MGIFGNKYPPLSKRLRGIYYCENKDSYYEIYRDWYGEITIYQCDRKGENYYIYNQDYDIDEGKDYYWLEKDLVSSKQAPYINWHPTPIQDWYIDRHKSIIGDKEYKDRYFGIWKSFLIRSYPDFDPQYDFIVYKLSHDMVIFVDYEPRESTARELFLLNNLAYDHMGCTEKDMKQGSKSIPKNNENNARYEKFGETWAHIRIDKVRILPKLISENKISYETLEPLLGKEFDDLLWLKKLG